MNQNPTFTVIYSFEIVQGKEQEFISAWSKITELIYEFEGSYGSRLHKSKDNIFIGYAQWTDKATWQNSGDNLPKSASEIRAAMRSCCTKIETLFELELVQDLLHTTKYDDLPY